MKVRVDFSKNVGKIKAVNGVTNGPVADGEDFSSIFLDLNISSVRYHDTDGSGPNGRCAIDISRIFTNFDADENDENSYQFEHTDEIITAAIKCGAEVIYRLGESIDHSVKNRHAHPPKDFDKWCRICLKVIQHYNDGWANGFHYGIKYWELWNEPEGVAPGLENKKMWKGGTLQDMFLLYKKLSCAIKEYNSELKVGGLSFMYCDHALNEWLEYCQKENLPVDFISFHHYAIDLNWIKEESETAENLKKKYGYPNAEIIIGEWTSFYLEDFDGKYWGVIGDQMNNKQRVKELRENQANEKGASFALGFLIRMNDLPIDKGAFYNFTPRSFWCSLLDYYYNPTKTYQIFKNYGKMLKQSTYRAFAEADKGYVIASKGDGCADCLLSNFLGDKETANFECVGVKDFSRLEIYAVDEEHENEIVYAADVTSDNLSVEIPVGKFSSLYLSLKK